MAAPTAAIVDFRLGNLFSVQQACRQAGIDAEITDDAARVQAADLVFLPGVGAFGDAMRQLHALDLVQVLKDVAAAGKPLVGICLGQQLLMGRSEEFGDTEGLGLIPGDVTRLDAGLLDDGRPRKVPFVGWSPIHPVRADGWQGTPLAGVPPGGHMYFVHSYYVRPTDPSDRLAETTYGDLTYCAVLRRGNVIGCQFHPERSGRDGLVIYQALADSLADRPA